jgi:hypothetical protein
VSIVAVTPKMMIATCHPFDENDCCASLGIWVRALLSTNGRLQVGVDSSTDEPALELTFTDELRLNFRCRAVASKSEM